MLLRNLNTKIVGRVHVTSPSSCCRRRLADMGSLSVVAGASAIARAPPLGECATTYAFNRSLEDQRGIGQSHRPRLPCKG